MQINTIIKELVKQAGPKRNQNKCKIKNMQDLNRIKRITKLKKKQNKVWKNMQ